MCKSQGRVKYNKLKKKLKRKIAKNKVKPKSKKREKVCVCVCGRGCVGEGVWEKESEKQVSSVGVRWYVKGWLIR